MSKPPPAWGQIVVYDNTTSPDPLNYFSANIATFGDQVTLASTERTVTSFSVGLFASAPLTANLALSFYDIGGGNSVGTQIGSTAIRTAVTLPSGPSVFTFSGLDIPVPSSLIWGVSFNVVTDPINNYLSGRVAGPPAIGSSDESFSYLLTGQEGFFTGLGSGTFAGRNDNVMAEIVAVPESSGYALIFGAVAIGVTALSRRGSGRTFRPRSDRV